MNCKNIMGRGVPLAMLLVMLLAALTPAVAEDADKIIKKIQKKYRDTKTITISFKEISRSSLTGTETRLSGLLRMEGRQKFRLELEDQVLVNNGETLWRYNKLEDQVLIDYAKKDKQDVILNNFLFEIEDHYYGQIIEEDKQGKRKVYGIKLTPKPNENSPFTSIKIWVFDTSWEISRIVYTDYNDNEKEYGIEKMTFNPSFDDSVFNFIPPESIQVIDLRF